MADVQLPEMSTSGGLLASLCGLEALASSVHCSSDEDKELIFLAAERVVSAFGATLALLHHVIG